MNNAAFINAVDVVEREVGDMAGDLSGYAAAYAAAELIDHWRSISHEDLSNYLLEDVVVGDLNDTITKLTGLRDTALAAIRAHQG